LMSLVAMIRQIISTLHGRHITLCSRQLHLNRS
jgi:hypothetical protein